MIGYFNTNPSVSYACLFGDISVPATLRGYSELQCVTPPVILEVTLSVVPIAIQINAQDVFGTLFVFEYYRNPIVLWIQPELGDLRGDTVINVHGNYFADSQHAICKFGNISSPVFFHI